MSCGRSPTDSCFGQDSPSQPANTHVHPVLLEQNEDEQEGQEEKWGPSLPLPHTHRASPGPGPPGHCTHVTDEEAEAWDVSDRK